MSIRVSMADANAVSTEALRNIRTVRSFGADLLDAETGGGRGKAGKGLGGEGDGRRGTGGASRLGRCVVFWGDRPVEGGVFWVVRKESVQSAISKSPDCREGEGGQK